MNINMTNILLIENQEKQFQSIYERFKLDDLSCTYKIFPDEFIKFIDCVRVWVNENYSTYDKNNLNNSTKNLSYRELAMGKIIQTISDNNIDIILMDFKLGAGYLSKTGIDLATQINEIRVLNNLSPLPVVFISKDLKNPKIEDEFKKYKWENRWVYKGFFGDEILQSKYIKDYVIKEVVALLSNSKGTSEQDKEPVKETSI